MMEGRVRGNGKGCACRGDRSVANAADLAEERRKRAAEERGEEVSSCPKWTIGGPRSEDVGAVGSGAGKEKARNLAGLGVAPTTGLEPVTR